MEIAQQQKNDDEKYLQEALSQGKKEWRRSKIMIVGEGRAGKTALANSILGRGYENLDSTIGINEFTVSIGYASVGGQEGNSKVWNEMKDQKQSKEFEQALASMVFDSKTGKVKQQGGRGLIDVDELAKKLKGGYMEGENKGLVAENGEGNSKPSERRDAEAVARGAGLNAARRKSHNDEKHESGDHDDHDTNDLLPQSTNKEKRADTNQQGPGEIDTSLVMRYLGEQSRIESKFLISVFDFGGQSVFNVIHPFFLTRFGVYVIAFNMEWLSSSADPAVKEDCIRYMTHWLNSVIIHTQNEKGEVAPLLFVGTRKDIITSPAEHQNISTYLYNVFCNSIAWSYVVENNGAEGPNGRCDLCFFPVNNKLGNRDPTVQKLLGLIEDTIDQSSYVHVERPLSWFQVLDQFKSRNVPYMSYDEVSEIVISCGIPKNRVPTLLRFFHEMGILMWHDEDTLRNVVVFDPIEYFVKPATIIICKHVPDQSDGIYHSTEIHRKVKKMFPKEFREMIQHGIISDVLLEALLEPHKENLLFIKQLMLKYGLLVPLVLSKGQEDEDNREATSEEEQLYLAPALLAEKNEDTNILVAPTDNDQDKSRVFSFVFTPSKDLGQMTTITLEDCSKLGFLPSGLFEKLIAKAVTWSMKTSNFINRFSLYSCYKNYAELAFGNQRFHMTIDYYHNLISIWVIDGSNPLGVHDRLKDQIQEIISECLKSLNFLSVLKYQVFDGRDNFSQQLNNLLLIRLNQIRSLVEKKSSLSINIAGGRNLLSSMEAMQLYGSWLTDYMSYEEYDVFISYRWGRYDSVFTKALFDRISLYPVDGSMRPIRTFLDVKRLQAGENYLTHIVKALTRSLLIIPIVSSDALQKMKQLKETDEDNVLIEWICGLELIKKHEHPGNSNSSSSSSTSVRLMKFMPIFFGSRVSLDSNGIAGEEKVGNFFQENVIQELPTIRPKACIDVCRHLLKKAGITMSEEMEGATVRDIVREVTKYLFVCGWESKNSHQLTTSATDKIVTILNECLESLPASHPVHSTGTAVIDAPPSISYNPSENPSSRTPAGPGASTAHSSSTPKEMSLNELKEILKKEFGISSNNMQEVLKEALSNLSEEEQSICNQCANTKEKAAKIIEILGLI